MTDAIDEATIIAWIDGELSPVEADRVAQAVAGDPALAALAADHRRLRDRFHAAFAPLAQPAPPVADVVSLADARDARRRRAFPGRWRWMPPALAASLVLGLALGQFVPGSRAIDDRAGALALGQPIGRALDDQLSGEGDRVRVALSFRDREGHYCRSFVATHLSGVACRGRDGWQLRYGSPATGPRTDYRMAGDDEDRMAAVTALIDGEPLDRAQERDARSAGWR